MRLASLFAVCFTLASGAAAQGWPTTDWKAFCFDGGEGGVWTVGEHGHTQPGAGVIACTGHFRRSADHIQRDLAGASRWLEGLGFHAPRVDRSQDGSRYLFAIGADRVVAGGDDVDGVYRIDDPGGQVVFDSQHLGESGEGEQDKRATGAHELFHGVQAATPFWISQESAPQAHSWIKEGTAQAMEWAWLKRNYLGGTGDLFKSKYTARNYSDPLHQPDYEQDYSTGHFWAGVGEILGGEPMAYLQRLLESNAWHAQSALSAVDQALRSEHPDGLYHLLPEFAARHLTERNDSVFELDGEFVAVTPQNKTHTVTAHGPLAPVAVHGHDLKVDPLGGTPHSLVVEIPDLPHLHLIVDGQRVDGSLGVRNRFETTVSGASESRHRILVVNVAPEAKDSQAARYEVTVEATPLETCGGEPGAEFVLAVAGSESTASTTASFALQASRMEYRGREIVDYPGLSVIKQRDGGVIVSYVSEGELSAAQQMELIRERLGLSQDLTLEEVSDAFSALPFEQRAPLIEELMDDEPPSGVPDGFGVSTPGDRGAGTFSMNLKKGDTNAMIGFFGSVQEGSGVYEGPLLNIGIQAPAFRDGSLSDPGQMLSAQEGRVLAQTRLEFTQMDPGRCVAGRFSGVYEHPVGQANPVTGSFVIRVPADATVVDLN